MTTAEVSWDAIARRLRPFIVKRVETSADAEDVLQEVLLRLHRGLPQVEDEARLFAWIYRVALNAIADHGRMRARHPLARSEAPEAVETLEEDDEAMARSLALSLGDFIAQLPSPYREAITLTELEGRTQKEAAEMMGVSLSGMKSRVQRGRAQLRKMLEACCEIAVDARGRVIDFHPRAPTDCCD